MKTLKILFVLLVTTVGFSTVNQVKSQQVDVNFSTFYNELSPYGTWVNSPQYGQVWMANEPDFQPYYSNGNWDYTDQGWYWNSGYPWGWAAFHYGRWELDPMYGWVWIPGYDWAPAWVVWSENPDYYGWAPMGYGVGLNVSIGSIPYNRWMFLPRQYITSRNFYNYGIRGSRNPGLFRNASIINYGRNDRYMRGPDRFEVERFTHNRIEPRRIESFRGGSNRFDGGSRNNQVFNERRNGNFNAGRDNGFNGNRSNGNSRESGDRNNTRTAPQFGQDNNRGMNNSGNVDANRDFRSRNNGSAAGASGERRFGGNAIGTEQPQRNLDQQRNGWNGNVGNRGGEQQGQRQAIERPQPQFQQRSMPQGGGERQWGSGARPERQMQQRQSSGGNGGGGERQGGHGGRRG